VIVIYMAEEGAENIRLWWKRAVITIYFAEEELAIAIYMAEEGIVYMLRKREHGWSSIWGKSSDSHIYGGRERRE
jgi:hypothetical protein